MVVRSVERNLEEDSLFPIHHLSYDTPPFLILWQNRRDGEKETRWSKWDDDISSEFMCKLLQGMRVKGVDWVFFLLLDWVVVESGF